MSKYLLQIYDPKGSEYLKFYYKTDEEAHDQGEHYCESHSGYSYMTWEEVEESDALEEFYNLLKASIKGRVVNGNMEGCILESELKEIYEHFRRSRE